MKLVSDFDGVWTQPEAEAASQGEVLERLLEEAAPERLRPQLPAWIAAARAAVRAAPTRYGWAPGGRLSAFGDEDPFTAHSALLHFVHLEAPRDRVAAALADALAARGQTLESLGARSHAEGVARVVAARGPGILPEASRAGRSLLAHDAEVVLVSNSENEKLVKWFSHAGLPHAVHPAGGARRLRLRGASRKFELDPARSEKLELGDAAIEVARPAYERVLLEERPAAVVGDVFSLDLALPLALKRRHPEWSGVRLFWLLQPYTPEWLRERVARHAGGEVEPVEGGLASVAARVGAALADG